MDILEMARNSGMLVILDGRIGHEEYHSVSGSLQALQRFANALRESLSLKATAIIVEPQSSPRAAPARGTGCSIPGESSAVA